LLRLTTRIFSLHLDVAMDMPILEIESGYAPDNKQSSLNPEK